MSTPQWQCSGCKQLFNSEKNVKIHVNVHLTRIQLDHPSRRGGRGPGGPPSLNRNPGRPSAAGGPGSGPGSGRRGPAARTRAVPAPGPGHLSTPPHWRNWPGPPAPPQANLYNAIILPRGGAAGGRARVAVLDSDRGPGPPRDDSGLAGRRGGRPGRQDSDSESRAQSTREFAGGEGGAAADDSEDDHDDWMEHDEEADCPDFDREEPGKQYYVQ